METTMRKRGMAAAVAIALCGGVQAQTNQELKETLEQATRTIQDLQSRVRALEAQQRSRPPAGAPAAPAPATPPAAPPAESAGAPVVAPNVAAEPGVPNPDKAHVELYGQA